MIVLPRSQLAEARAQGKRQLQFAAGFTPSGLAQMANSFVIVAADTVSAVQVTPHPDDPIRLAGREVEYIADRRLIGCSSILAGHKGA